MGGRYVSKLVGLGSCEGQDTTTTTNTDDDADPEERVSETEVWRSFHDNEPVDNDSVECAEAAITGSVCPSPAVE